MNKKHFPQRVKCSGLFRCCVENALHYDGEPEEGQRLTCPSCKEEVVNRNGAWQADKGLVAICIQQGGSSSEYYASGYDSLEEARKAAEAHEEASYQADTMEVPEALRKRLIGDEQAEADLLEMLRAAARIGADL